MVAQIRPGGVGSKGSKGGIVCFIDSHGEWITLQEFDDQVKLWKAGTYPNRFAKVKMK